MIRKRILFFINHFPSRSETFVKDEIEYFKKAGFHVEVLCHLFETPLDHIQFHQTGLTRNYFQRFLGALKILIRGSLRKKIELLNYTKYGSNSYNLSLLFVANFFLSNNKKYDLIFCQFGTNGKYVCQLKQAGIIKPETKIVVRFHGIDLSLKTFGSNYYKILNTYCDKIIVGSELAVEQLKALKIYNPKKVEKIPVSYDLNKFAARNLKEQIGKIKILSVGRLIEWKGHLEAIDIIQLLKAHHPEIEFEYQIIGEGPLYNTLRKKIDDNNLSKFITLSGSKNHDVVLETMSNSDIFLYPGKIDENGRQETQGAAVGEAMGCSCIIISSEVGGVKEYVKNYYNGLLCKPGDYSCFVEHIITSAKDYELRKKLVENARKTIIGEYDRDKNYNLLVNSILTILN